MTLEELLPTPFTVRFIPAHRLTRERTLEIGKIKAKGCLFKLAYLKGECWELWENLKSRDSYVPMVEDRNEDFSIPTARFNDDMVSYYKIARSSQFPSHAFLGFYHILEYNFLRVSDEILHAKVKVQLNSPEFNTSYEKVSKLVSVIKRHDTAFDEAEMLKAVLLKYVPEDDLIQFVINLERDADDKIYSKPRRDIFGERLAIRLEQGHALSNTAKVLKHIRNALVHASDRYNREECILPFSEGESIVYTYIPIVQFLSERVLFATADA
jgi:hypothetical protein